MYPFFIFAQTTTPEKISFLVDDSTGSFIFKAKFANPSSGEQIYLTSVYYYVLFTKDSIKAFLPYFGRAFSGPAMASHGALKFISFKYQKQLKQRKKGIDVTFLLKDVEDVWKLSIVVTKDATGSLTLYSNRLQTISYIGNVEKGTNVP